MLKAEQLGQTLEKQVPKTIENTRVMDETFVSAGDETLEADENNDEFASYFSHQQAPKLLITTCSRPSKNMFLFLTDLLEVLTNAHYYKRQGYAVKKIVDYAIERDFTDVLVFNENRKSVNGLLLIHLPGGPTAQFKVSNVVLSKQIKGHGRPTKHRPELLLNHFDTQLGRRLGRMLACLFSSEPMFRGRQVATFHNQRDYIFFRHHRYVFEKKERKVAVIPSAASLVIKALKEPPRDRKKEKNIRHSGNLTLDEVTEIARVMRERSCARKLAGTVKEILGTCVSVGCTVDHQEPRELQQKIDDGELDIPEE
ncbi:hypothetical protein WJX73_005398 [Symbiochloris irregularis]|uniref:Brix domain-containing protein n=1 Tax=Symbiochloris irregularis TaxID=706552 RepID=A0AAW1NW17_9CHLO